ncbi:hypothetical protein OKW21_002091 [Catalinimonas alkaloidigena]|uniref:hypothetical protein n=1 Tax=Catalinimonas alkaloidigena TaxID=1075417 RepID=UPI0024071E8D|nr:hypothetical protein [Catalinimonas alkaloidigena]MDF9796828.1 hypothetical protein [Catalinimonas alkaloidigena]
MFGLEVLEVVIGLIFVYLLLSLLATTLNEMVMKWLYSRGTNLKIALQTMLNDDGNEDVLCHKFFEHPLIQKLRRKEKGSFPSYISNQYFSKVILELLYAEEGGTLDKVKEGIGRLPEGKTKEVLHSFLSEAEGNLEQFKKNLEAWYEEMMMQATSWYKARVQVILFFLGLVISIVLNADTFKVAKKLSVDPEARTAIITQAEAFMESQEGRRVAATEMNMDSLHRQIYYLIEEEISMSSSALGMGWNKANYPPIMLGELALWGWLRAIPGWIVTALAITLGAPFWFDLLKRLMTVRADGKAPKEE